MGWFDEYMIRFTLTSEAKRRCQKYGMAPNYVYFSNGPDFDSYGELRHKAITFGLTEDKAAKFYDKAEAKRYMKQLEPEFQQQRDLPMSTFFSSVEYVPYKDR